MADPIKFVFNPLKGELDASRQGAVAEAQQASRVVLEFDCDASLAVGDLVFQDTVVANKVIECTDNTTVEPTIGVCITKLTATTAEILVLGTYAGYSGLTIGSKVFLDTDGTETTNAPSTGYLQTLGTVVAPDTIFFLPNSQRVLQI